ncbi:LURP-one-related family protein [Corynebacterium sp. YSMAA1_1_F7]|uniref:LURP-one-related family protein n=1 Tax=Corynebacterium sp. YSMAA1_1_F7 TaxID=3383590 RepID=UPI0038D17285
MLKSNELIISQFLAIGPDEFTISDPQDVQLGSARQTWKASDLFKGSHGVEIFDAADTLVLSIENPLYVFGDEYFVHRADPESGEKAELAHISKRFAWFSTRYDVHIAGYPQMEINGEAFQLDYTLISQGRTIAQVNAESPGVGRALMGKTAYRITLEPGLDGNLHAAVLGIAFALDMRRKKMRKS